MTSTNMTELIAVTGATGYVGGRLIPRLLKAGYRVRCIVRNSEALDDRPWRSQVEVFTCDLNIQNQVNEGLKGAHRAYYLVHSMAVSSNFEDLESSMAKTFVAAADTNQIAQIIYLGGLGEEKSNLSPHLTSRQKVGEILASGKTPVTELRAAIIIGSGSASFEMLRSLVEILPIMVVPKWVTKTRCQPVAISDVLFYLVSVLGNEKSLGKVFDVGGPDVLTYKEMMHTYAKVASLKKRIIIPVPVLTPRLSSHWVNLTSPLPIRLARALIDSLTSDVVVNNNPILDSFDHKPDNLRNSIGRALTRVQDLQIPTRWSDPGKIQVAELPELSDPDWSGGKVLTDSRKQNSTASRDQVMSTIRTIGGDTGWFAFDRLWAVRGFIDKMVGGVGLRRGRRHPTELRVSDPVDFFTVVRVDSSSLLLRAEMLIPGHAWLEWSVTDLEKGCLVEQKAQFVPRGVIGRLYWFALLIPHSLIFKKMLSKIIVTTEIESLHDE